MKKNLFAVTVLSLVLFAGCKEDEVVLSEEEQLAVDIELIDEYLASNNIDAEAHESGIRYVVETEGTGDSPNLSSVIVKYKGYFLDGVTFDQNELGANINLGGNIIDSWKIMVSEMKEGEKITIYSPSLYCYGRQGKNPVPPNTVLVFEIELVSLVRSASEQLAIDLEKIDQHLTNNSIKAEIHSSGIRYVVIEEGTGLNPNLNDLITVNYFGQFFNGEIFDEGSNVKLRLSEVIDAWKTMVPTMQEDGIIMVYAPSGLCYGNIGNDFNIAPNTNLIFRIDLVAVGQQ